MKAELIDTIPVANTLGEGISWDPRTGHVWWTDVEECRLYRLHYESRTLDSFELPERLGSFGFTDNVDILVCAFESGFALYRPETGELSEKQSVEADWAGTRMNDGRLDPQGRFWAGSMIEDPANAPPQGAGLYSYHDQTISQHLDGINISNGLAWSNNGKKLYFSDSPKREIYAFDFDQEAGKVSNRSVFAKTPEGAYPDGAMVDGEGYLWSAHWGASRLVRYRPDGTIDHTLDVPASQASCLAFGGPEMNIIFVTSARTGLSPDVLAQEGDAGNVFIYKTDFKGKVPDSFYKIEK